MESKAFQKSTGIDYSFLALWVSALRTKRLSTVLCPFRKPNCVGGIFWFLSAQPVSR